MTTNFLVCLSFLVLSFKTSARLLDRHLHSLSKFKNFSTLQEPGEQSSRRQIATDTFVLFCTRFLTYRLTSMQRKVLSLSKVISLQFLGFFFFQLHVLHKKLFYYFLFYEFLFKNIVFYFFPILKNRNKQETLIF